MQYTEKLKLKKPDLTDYVNVGDLNDNVDIIDAELKRQDEELVAHLAEIVSQAEPNKILRLDENGKLPTDITGDAATVGGKTVADLADGAWEKIAEQTLATAVAQVDFSSIPSGYKNLKIIFDVGGTNTAQNLMLRFNDDGGARYRHQDIVALNTTLSTSGIINDTAIILSTAIPPTNAAFSFGIVDISNFDALKEKRIKAEVYYDGSATPSTASLRIGIVGGAWNNKTNEINKISLIATTYQFEIGSRFVLWGCK